MMHPRDESTGSVDGAVPEPEIAQLPADSALFSSSDMASGSLPTESAESTSEPLVQQAIVQQTSEGGREVPVPNLLPVVRPQVSDERCGQASLPAELPSAELTKSNPQLPTLVVGGSEPPAGHVAYSTLSSLLVVFVLILTIRFTVPPLVESLRYSWHHGQLRAEYEMAGQRLQNVSLNSLTEASELVSRRVGPSVVHINMLEVYATRSGSKKTEAETVGQGSGVILDDEGYILTNQHVLDEDVLTESAGHIEVVLSDGRRLAAERIGVDAATDLAVIRVRADGLLPSQWGDSDRVDVGTPVWAVGSPFGLERTVTFGIISGKHRMNLRGTRWDLTGDPKSLDRSQATIYRDLMQTDVAVNPGNSGGPLVNSKGEIVGINTAILDEHYIGISFAIPSNVARRVAEHLIRDGKVARGWLGVELEDPETTIDESTGNKSTLKGAVVKNVLAGDSPARLAGILTGDLIVKFGDYPITNFRELVGRVAQTDIGVTVPVEVIRNGESMILSVEISRRQEQRRQVPRR